MSEKMSRANLPYTAATALFCLGVLPGAVMNIAQPEVLLSMATTLDMPLYVLTLVGIWKLLGVVALALPGRLKRLNEWAYAGFFFDLTGAAWAHGAVGDTAGIAPPLVLVSVLLASYFLRPAAAVAAAPAQAAA